MREHELKHLVGKHHGQLKMIDAFYRQSNLTEHFKNELSDCNIVIMVQNLCKHATSKAITSIMSKSDQKFAIANAAGLQLIEQAIYRADQGLPAYENSQSTINYPTK